MPCRWLVLQQRLKLDAGQTDLLSLQMGTTVLIPCCRAFLSWAMNISVNLWCHKNLAWLLCLLDFYLSFYLSIYLFYNIQFFSSVGSQETKLFSGSTSAPHEQVCVLPFLKNISQQWPSPPCFIWWWVGSSLFTVLHLCVSFRLTWTLIIVCNVADSVDVTPEISQWHGYS